MRDSKMTVATLSIWKSAAAAVRQPVRTLEKNLHIGGTLRDLYVNEQVPSGDEAFSDLLKQLDASEDAAKTWRRR